MSHNAFLMNKPWALWKYLIKHGKKHGKKPLQAEANAAHLLMSVRLRAAPFSSPLESCRSCAIKIKPGSSKSSGAQTQQPREGVYLARRNTEETVPGGEGLPGGLLKLCLLWLVTRPFNYPKNSSHVRKKKNVWGQSKGKMFQGTASSAGRCGATVIGGAWEVHAGSQERH